jgi:ATP-dependent DNA helicase RecQ
MKDQVDSLLQRHIPATFINSTLAASEQNSRLKKLSAGEYKIVYIAPERMRNVTFLKSIQDQGISLLAVDEAHCISEWGHDFRPDYLQIIQLRKALNDPLTVALTATATPQVQNDIIRLLGLSNAEKIVTGFNRPNLFFEVRYTTVARAKLQALSELLTTQVGSAIIYAGTRRDAEDVADFIRQVLHLKAEHYHAGLETSERTRVQDDYMSGRLPIVVATNAFGMGVDRQDVRLVIHLALPGSLEAYYQEAGRAGRDGLEARVVLLYAPEDRALQEFFINNSAVNISELRALYNALPQLEDWMSIDDFALMTGISEVKARLGLAELERIGACERLGDMGLRMLLRRGKWDEKAITDCVGRVMEHQKHRKKQLSQMIRYAETNLCRRAIILNHFGDPESPTVPKCCDNCIAKQRVVPSSVPIAAFPSPVEETSQALQPQRVGLIIPDTVRRQQTKVGREKLAQILKGSHSADITKFHYDRNVYYGRFAGLPTKQVVDMIDQLIQLGFLKVLGGRYPVLNLTSQGEAAIQAKQEIQLKMPKQLQPEVISRKKSEREAGGTVEYTAQLLTEGLNPDQIAKKRGLTHTTIYGHLAQLIRMGMVRVEDVVLEEIRQQIESAIKQVGNTDILYTIKILLPDEISYDLIQCVVEGWKISKDKSDFPNQGKFQGQSINKSKDSKGEKIHQIVSLGESKSLSAIPGLIEALENPDGNIRRLAASALGKIGDPRATEPLLKLLSTEQKQQVRQYAVSALGRIGDPRSISFLQTIADDTNERHYTREAAKAAIRSLKDKMVLEPGLEKESQSKNPYSRTENDAIDQYLSTSHPRQLTGLWQSGWALGFHSSFSGAEWNRSSTGELAYRLKYQGDLEAIPPLVEQSLALITEHPELAQVDAILPVPPSTHRAVDPVSAFAIALGQRAGIPVNQSLTKTRQTSPQKEFHTLAQKYANVAGAFAIQTTVKGKRLLVVDDLFDSGATLEEITRLLYRSGAGGVCVLTLTRTIHSDA